MASIFSVEGQANARFLRMGSKEETMEIKGFIINEPLPRCCGVCPCVSFMDARKYSGNEGVSAAFCNLLGGAVPRSCIRL